MSAWKDIPGYEGVYKVSDSGSVYSYSKERLLNAHHIRKYRRVWLRKDSKNKPFLVHRLVLLAFVGKPLKDQTECLHLDNDPSNNSLKNLRWGSHRENMMMDRGNNHSFKGEKNKNSKLTKTEVKFIRQIYANRNGFRWGRRGLAKKYNISEAQVLRIAKSEKGGWNHVR